MSFDEIDTIGKKKSVKKASYSIDEAVLDKFDKIAKAEKLNKSLVIEELLKVFVEKKESLI